MLTATLIELSRAARPIDDHDYGSDRQVDAENAFFDACREVDPFVFGEDSQFSNYCLKATPEEAIDEAIRLMSINQ